MCGFGDLALGDLLEGVLALAVGVEGVHEMHFEELRVVAMCGCWGGVGRDFCEFRKTK